MRLCEREGYLIRGEKMKQGRIMEKKNYVLAFFFISVEKRTNRKETNDKKKWEERFQKRKRIVKEERKVIVKDLEKKLRRESNKRED